MISLQVNDLTKKYNQHHIFEALSFEHNKGIFGIAGANGSGKSTLLKCLAYLLRPNSGTISWQQDGTDLSQDEVKAQIGYAAPYINLYAELSISENLRFLMEARGEKADLKTLEQTITRLQIPQLADKLYGNLSTGQQQRAKLAAAIIRKPQILMLDEPGSNLDEKGHQLVANIVNSEAEKGTLVFLASNDPAEIALCDTVLEVRSNEVMK